jgi:methylenetetrahydrofolate reductase (NADPH)
MDNRLRGALSRGSFAITVEVVAPQRDTDVGTALAPALTLARALAQDPRIAGLSVTDRVRSDDDHDAIDVATRLASASGTVPIVHLSGKDRCPADHERAIDRLRALGLANLLCVTGDRLKTPPPGRRVRYLDSVDAVALVRRCWPDALVGGGICPYKYTEEETYNQLFKMAKKEAAGADYLVTQVGWDIWKLAELARYRTFRGFTRPVLANVMSLPLGVARYLHKGAVPGVFVSDDLLALVEAEATAPDKGAAARLTRLALQVVGAKRLGYAGAHLSMVSRYEDVCRLLELVTHWRRQLRTLDDWWQAWETHHRLPDGRAAQLGAAPQFFLHGPDARNGTAPSPAAGELRRYRLGRLFHALAFHPASPVYWALRPLARRVRPGTPVEAWVMAVESRIKEPLFGCRMCGFCRLPDTFYVCPETCPKGLANGPCGGSMNNRCEAGLRECVHSVRYRLAKAGGQLERLERVVIPPIPEPWGGSSWVNHFAGRSPAARQRGNA